YADREGDIINAKISHFDAGSAIMELDRGATAILPRPEQAPHERYFAGQARKVVVLEVRRTLRGPQIIVSRAHKGLVKRLVVLESEPEAKTAYVIVPHRQLSLGIGKDGQNAGLAAKLPGWRIDIRSESEVRAEVEPEPEPEPVAVAEPVPAEEESEIRHALV